MGLCKITETYVPFKILSQIHEKHARKKKVLHRVSSGFHLVPTIQKSFPTLSRNAAGNSVYLRVTALISSLKESGLI